MQKGEIKLATGPMFSGKTTWIIRQLSTVKDELNIAIRYTHDNRYSGNSLASHNGHSCIAQNAKSVNDVLKVIKQKPNFKALGLDEIQFFEPKLADLFEELKRKGIKVFAAGLDTDYRGMVWQTTKKIEEIADEILRFKARCSVCKKSATMTYRKPGEVIDKRIVIGGKELYEPRCVKHFRS